MKKILFVFVLFCTSNANAQKKPTINQRNADELEADLHKAQKGLDNAKRKLAYVDSTCRNIAQKETEAKQKKSGIQISQDSVYQKIKEQKNGHFKIAENRVKKWQNRYDKISSKHSLVMKNYTIVPNRIEVSTKTRTVLFLSFNPSALLEPMQGAVGLGIGYRVSQRVELWAEGSYLYSGIFTKTESFENVHGFKSIFNGKYFIKTRRPFFIGIELRLKDYSLDDKRDFENKLIADTIRNYPYQLHNQLFGAGTFIGKKFSLSKNGKFEMEGLVGIGLKYRKLDFRNIPAGYTKIDYELRDHFQIFPENYFYTEQWLPYIPAAIRFIYHLK